MVSRGLKPCFMQIDTKLLTHKGYYTSERGDKEIMLSRKRSLVLSCRKVRNYSQINRIKIGLFKILMIF